MSANGATLHRADVHTGAMIPEDTADRLRRELGEAIAEERVTRVEAERVVTESKERERRYVKALAALDATTTRVVAHRQPGKPSKSNDWHVSDKKIEQVWQYALTFVRERPKDKLTVAALANSIDGLSPESTRRAFERLRGDERLRAAGRFRGGVVYKVMPEHAGVDSAA